MAKKSLHIPDDIDQRVIAAAPGESYSGRVAHLLTIADHLTAAAIPTLSAAEWAALRAALADYRPVYDTGPEAVLRGAWFALYVAAERAAAAHGIDARALAERLATLPLAAQAGIFEKARRAGHDR